jgi:hypothetical protein
MDNYPINDIVKKEKEIHALLVLYLKLQKLQLQCTISAYFYDRKDITSMGESHKHVCMYAWEKAVYIGFGPNQDFRHPLRQIFLELKKRGDHCVHKHTHTYTHMHTHTHTKLL